MTNSDFAEEFLVVEDRIAVLDCAAENRSHPGHSALHDQLYGCLVPLVQSDALDGLVLLFRNVTMRNNEGADTPRVGAHPLGAVLSERNLVTIAALDGPCSGVGAELAVWCDYRVATDRIATTLAFTHTRMGIIPPAAATVRLPRLVGVPAAAYLIAGGQPVAMQVALRIGLVDHLVTTPDHLVPQARTLIHGLLGTPRLAQRRAKLRGPLPDADACLPAVNEHLPRLLVVTDHPAPNAARAAIQSMHRTLSLSASDGLQRVAADTSTRPAPSAARALRHVDQLVRASSKTLADPGGSDAVVTPGCIGICGAGIMGSGIAAEALAHGIPVRLHDASTDAMHRARAAIRAEFAADRQAPWPAMLCQPDAERLLNCCDRDDDLHACGLIIESVVENRALKQRILKRLETVGNRETVLASNTSTLPITDLADRLTYPDRFCGLHFCNPVRQRQLVEVVRGRGTSQRTLATVVGYARRMGKLPIVVRDEPGFLINRLLVAYLNEALTVLCEGAPIGMIDRAARTFGMPLSPFELLDLIGTDTAMMAGRSLWEAFPDRVTATPVLPALVKRNRLGWKTKLGFYRYESVPGPAHEDTALGKIIAPYIRHRVPDGAADLMRRLLLPMVLEATRVLDAGVVGSPSEIDAGVIFGLAFPARRGGICYWADQIGSARIIELLARYRHLGGRMEPTDRLRRMAAHGVGFYPDVSQKQ